MSLCAVRCIGMNTRRRTLLAAAGSLPVAGIGTGIGSGAVGGSTSTVDFHEAGDCLDAGEHEFDEAIDWPADGSDVEICGQGKEETVLQAGDELPQLVRVREDDPDREGQLIIEGLTLDLMDEPTDVEHPIIDIKGDRGDVILRDVAVRGVNIPEMEFTSGVILVTGVLDHLQIEDCEFRFDTFAGRPSFENKYRVVHNVANGDESRIDEFEARRNVHYGDLGWDTFDREDNDEDYYNGYKIEVGERAVATDCHFDGWDQYCINFRGHEDATLEAEGLTTVDHGGGDQFMFGARADGVTVEASDLTSTGTGDDPESEKIDGDRVLNFQGSQSPESATVSNCEFQDCRTGIAVMEGSDLTFSDIEMRNMGLLDGSGNRAVQVLSRHDWTGDITLENVRVLNGEDDPRSLEYVVELGSIEGEGYGWEWPFYVEDCRFEGFEGDAPINDDATGPPVPTELSNLHARNADGEEPDALLASEV